MLIQPERPARFEYLEDAFCYRYPKSKGPASYHKANRVDPRACASIDVACGACHPVVGGSHISTWSSDQGTGGKRGNSSGATRQAERSIEHRCWSLLYQQCKVGNAPRW
eukprot:6493016-Pyramimonas_sp.AAC.1